MKLLILTCFLIFSTACFAETNFKNPVFNVDLEPISRGERNIRVYSNKMIDLDYPNQGRTDCETLEDNEFSITLKCTWTPLEEPNKLKPVSFYEKFISVGPSEHSCSCMVKRLSYQTLKKLQKEEDSSGYLCATKATTCGKIKSIDQN